MAFSASSTLIVLCGKTGSGKTLLLQHLEESGYPVINLEKIASHRGSAFGGLLLAAQPSQKEFEYEIKKSVLKHASSPYIFIEQKPSSIGKRKIPEWLLAKMKDGIRVQLNVDKKTRVNNILKEYRAAGKENFIDGLQKLKDRLPETVIAEMKSLLNAENYEGFIEKMLDYYDNTLNYQLPARPNIILNTQSDDILCTAGNLVKLLQQVGVAIY